MRVPDGNGAGIRLERSDLQVINSLFRGSEEGILTANDPGATLSIDRSTFSRLGRCDRGLSCAHSVYTGVYGQVTVTHSRFKKGSGGHYLKRSEEHTSELQSLMRISYAVFCLKKKKRTTTPHHNTIDKQMLPD